MSRAVLIAEDERYIADILSEVLAEEGYRVRSVADGIAALDEVDREPPDLVISDVSMPGLSGVGLVERLRARRERIPVILISAVYADVDIPGVVFVPKPFEIDHILAVAARVLDRAGE